MQSSVDSGKEVMELLEDCLWVYVNGDPKMNRSQAFARFRSLLAEKGVASPAAYEIGASAQERDHIVDLQLAHYQPMAKPVFLRAFTPEIIGALVSGRLMYKVFAYLDSSRFAELYTRAGARFASSTEKEARRAQAMPQPERPPLLRGRVAHIDVGTFRASITDPNLVEIYFDGLRLGHSLSARFSWPSGALRGDATIRRPEGSLLRPGEPFERAGNRSVRIAQRPLWVGPAHWVLVHLRSIGPLLDWIGCYTKCAWHSRSTWGSQTRKYRRIST
jgi:hypothetical protein